MESIGNSSEVEDYSLEPTLNQGLTCSPHMTCQKSPKKSKRIRYSRAAVMLKDGVVDFKQDNWKVKGGYPINGEWTGKTFFRAYGPYESDCSLESVEIREAITDFEFVGREKACMISMFFPQSIKGVFVEDNQGTIRISENGNPLPFDIQTRHSGLILVGGTVQEKMVQTCPWSQSFGGG